VPLDFSLQLADALGNFLAAPPPATPPAPLAPTPGHALKAVTKRRPLGVDDFER
jgi:hypothetical protein